MISMALKYASLILFSSLAGCASTANSDYKVHEETMKKILAQKVENWGKLKSDALESAYCQRASRSYLCSDADSALAYSSYRTGQYEEAIGFAMKYDEKYKILLNNSNADSCRSLMSVRIYAAETYAVSVASFIYLMADKTTRTVSDVDFYTAFFCARLDSTPASRARYTTDFSAFFDPENLRVKARPDEVIQARAFQKQIIAPIQRVVEFEIKREDADEVQHKKMVQLYRNAEAQCRKLNFDDTLCNLLNEKSKVWEGLLKSRLDRLKN